MIIVPSVLGHSLTIFRVLIVNVSYVCIQSYIVFDLCKKKCDCDSVLVCLLNVCVCDKMLLRYTIWLKFVQYQG